MLATTTNDIMKNFDQACDDAIQNCEPIIIARDNGNNVVLLSLAEYDILLENFYVR